MIERAARCLKDGGKYLLQRSKKAAKPQRSLHSAFWSHGASDINLPSWWIAFLQVPQGGRSDRVSAGPRITADGIISGIQEGGLLDFLYPTQTLAIIQHLLNSQKSRWPARRQPCKAIQSQRAFASNAALLDLEPDLKVVNDDSPGERADLSRPNSQSIAGNPLLNASIDWHAINARLDDQEADIESLWNDFLELQNASVKLPSKLFIKLMQRLKNSDSQTRTERICFMVHSINPEERRAIHYSLAIAVALGQGHYESAVSCYREALGRFQRFIGAPSILRHFVEKKEWRYATAVWEDYQRIQGKPLSSSSIWHNVGSLPVSTLMISSLQALKFAANHKAEQANDRKYDKASSEEDFALQLVNICLQAEAADVPIHYYGTLLKLLIFLHVAKSHIYELAIMQLLRRKERSSKVKALEYYKEARKAEDFLLDSKALHALLAGLRTFHAGQDIMMIIEDYEKQRQALPRSELLLAIAGLSHDGDIENVQKLFYKFIQRFPEARPVSLFNNILYTHWSRLDVKSSVTSFYALQEDYGFTPDVHTWNTVIATHARAGDVDGAIEWFDKLRSAGFCPNSKSYSCLIKMYARRGDLNEVLRLFHESESKGIVPVISMVNGTVQALVQNDRFDDALEMLDKASQMEMQGSRTRMWNYLLTALAQRGELEKVRETHQQMEDNNITSDAFTYAIMMHSLAMHKFPEAADKILHKVMFRAKLQPTSFHYAVVMGGYLKTKQYHRIFELYNEMIEKNIKPTFSAHNILIRTAAYMDIEQQGREKQRPGQLALPRAEEALKHGLKIRSPSMFALKEPYKGVGSERLSEAYSSTYFSFLMFLYGKNAALDKVADLYNQYISASQTLQPNVDITPPVKIITALMAANAEIKDHQEVQRCWYLALEKSRKLAYSANADVSEPSQVLYARRFILCNPLIYHIKSLEAEYKIQEIIDTIDSLQTEGFRLDSRCWNVYIQAMARNGRQVLAFELCEQNLISRWRGWAILGHPLDWGRKFKAMKPKSWQQELRMPMYQTLVFLAKAYMDINAIDPSMVNELKRVAPKTVDVVQCMPGTQDQVQTQILAQGEW